MFSIFGIIASVLMILLSYFIYNKFLILFFNKNISLIFIIALNLFQILYLFNLKETFIPLFLYKIGALSLGITFMLFIIMITYNISNLAFKIPFSQSRRLFLKNIFDVSIIILGFSYILKGIYDGFSKPKIKQIEVKIKNLQNNLKIAHITDIHIGKFLQKDFLDEIVSSINSQNPDLVVITGDLVDLKASEIKDNLDSLKNLKSKFGTYFVPGNHEYYHGVSEILEKIKTLNVKVLGNTNISVAGINLAGVYDLSAYKLNHHLKPNLNEALKNTNKNLPTVLLSHQPKFTNQIKDEEIDLILCGHTHAGQIFPFSILVLLDQPYLHGLYKHNEKTQVYVSSGAGFWGPPIRFLAPSEIAILNLKGIS